MGQSDKDWKLKLRYGKLETPYIHFTIIAPIVIEQYITDFKATPGKAYIGINVWASDSDEAIDVLQNIGEHTGYKVSGK
jgi:hypothetical protein